MVVPVCPSHIRLIQNIVYTIYDGEQIICRLSAALCQSLIFLCYVDCFFYFAFCDTYGCRCSHLCAVYVNFTIYCYNITDVCQIRCFDRLPGNCIRTISCAIRKDTGYSWRQGRNQIFYGCSCVVLYCHDDRFYMKVCRYCYFFVSNFQCSVQDFFARSVVHLSCQIPGDRTFLCGIITHDTGYGCLKLWFGSHGNGVFWFNLVIFQEYFTLFVTYGTYKYRIPFQTCGFCFQYETACTFGAAYDNECFSAECLDVCGLVACQNGFLLEFIYGRWISVIHTNDRSVTC